MYFVFSFSNFIIILTASSLIYFCFYCCVGFIFSTLETKKSDFFFCLSIDFYLQEKLTFLVETEINAVMIFA